MGSDNTSDTVKNTGRNSGIENLKPWKPGQSGNPNGRPPKGQALTDLMREMMEENPNIKKAIMAKLMEGAAKGDIAFIREVLDRIEGKPIQKNENKIVTDLQLGYEHSRHNEPSAETKDGTGSSLESEM